MHAQRNVFAPVAEARLSARTSSPVRHSVYTEKLSTRTHVADVRAYFSNVRAQFVVVHLSDSTGTYICSAQCGTVLHTGENAPL